MFLLVALYPTRTNTRLSLALRRLGVETMILSPEEASSRAQEGDTVVGRLDVPSSLDVVKSGLGEFSKLERPGIRVLNGRSALLATQDNLATTIQLAMARLPHPRTVHVDLGQQTPVVRYPVVVRPRFGDSVIGDSRCRTESVLRARLAEFAKLRWFRKHGALVQELGTVDGEHLRVVVVAGEVVGALAKPGWGGAAHRLSAVLPALEVSRLATAAAQALKADLVGVDLAPAPDGGYSILGLNCAVEFSENCALPGRNPFDDAARLLTAEPQLQAQPVAVAIGQSLRKAGSGSAREGIASQASNWPS